MNGGASTQDASRLVFLDEMMGNDQHARLQVAPHGERCVISTAWALEDYDVHCCIASNQCVTAPMVADGSMDGALFLAYVRDFLCPTLRPGDIVVADNLSSRRQQEKRWSLRLIA
ncbi:MAG: hypothetical protein P0107_02470 [Nitrosomonas sp.]|nr:hypothetical protein [Nitrosomonas sp.]